MLERSLAYCRSFSWKQSRLWITRSGLVGVGMIAAIVLALGWRMMLVFEQYPEPQATLILDGRQSRMDKAVMFAQEHPDLPIWVSGNCSHRPALKTAFTLARLSGQVHYDLRATDTVTNFTTLADDFRSRGIHHVYLVTSTYHMERAKAIAALVFGSRGIVVTPVALPEVGVPNESRLRIVRDGFRSLLWIATGRTGSSLNAHINHFPGGDSCRFQFRKKQALEN